MKETENYISVMIDGLEKKISFLQKISEHNAEQKTILETEPFNLDDFNANVEAKGKLIEGLVLLDNGFEAVYDRIRVELDNNRAAYTEQIKRMKSLIALITELSVKVQNEELKNNKLAQDRFSRLKQSVRETRKNNKAVSNYYKSMSKLDSSPQFMDKKK